MTILISKIKNFKKQFCKKKILFEPWFQWGFFRKRPRFWFFFFFFAVDSFVFFPYPYSPALSNRDGSETYISVRYFYIVFLLIWVPAISIKETHLLTAWENIRKRGSLQPVEKQNKFQKERQFSHSDVSSIKFFRQSWCNIELNWWETKHQQILLVPSIVYQ